MGTHSTCHSPWRACSDRAGSWIWLVAAFCCRGRAYGAGTGAVCLDNLAGTAYGSDPIVCTEDYAGGAPPMNILSIRCIKAAFVCLALGIGLGAWFAINRAQGALLRPLHAEFNLWGWATLLIYGMAY